MTVESDNPNAAAAKRAGFMIAASKAAATTSPQTEIREGRGNAARRRGAAPPANRASRRSVAKKSRHGMTADLVKKAQLTYAAGDLTKAEQFYRAVLDEEPQSA